MANRWSEVSSAPNGKRRQILPSADRKLAAPWAKGSRPAGVTAGGGLHLSEKIMEILRVSFLRASRR
jgi:hypothetical protein